MIVYNSICHVEKVLEYPTHPVINVSTTSRTFLGASCAIPKPLFARILYFRHVQRTPLQDCLRDRLYNPTERVPKPYFSYPAQLSNIVCREIFVFVSFQLVCSCNLASFYTEYYFFSSCFRKTFIAFIAIFSFSILYIQDFLPYCIRSTIMGEHSSQP